MNKLRNLTLIIMPGKRYEIILDHLTTYDYIVYLDCDAAFVNPNIKVETFIDETHDLFIAPDCMYLFLYKHIISVAKIFENLKLSSNEISAHLEYILSRKIPQCGTLLNRINVSCT